MPPAFLLLNDLAVQCLSLSFGDLTLVAGIEMTKIIKFCDFMQILDVSVIVITVFWYHVTLYYYVIVIVILIMSLTRRLIDQFSKINQTKVGKFWEVNIIIESFWQRR